MACNKTLRIVEIACGKHDFIRNNIFLIEQTSTNTFAFNYSIVNKQFQPSPSYQFGFDVNDDQFTNYQNRKEERQGDVIKGSYSVVDSDGFIRTVTYTADPKEGFKAQVERKPTDIVVKIPTPAPKLQDGPIRQQQTAQYLEASSPVHRQQQAQQQQPQQQQYYRYQ